MKSTNEPIRHLRAQISRLKIAESCLPTKDTSIEPDFLHDFIDIVKQIGGIIQRDIALSAKPPGC